MAVGNRCGIGNWIHWGIISIYRSGNLAAGARIQWLDAQSIFKDPEPVPIVGDHGSGVINLSRVFSDNGVFSARIRVQDDDGAEPSVDVVVYVLNLEPDVTLERDEAVSLSIGEVFIGRTGAEQFHQAMAVDPGSDDLKFVWEYSNGSWQMTYYNNGISPDPELSQEGIYPFSASDTAPIEFFSPGFHDIILEVIDDGGDSLVDFSKLITGNEMCTRSQGFWKHQFSGKGKPHFNEDILRRYLDLVDKASDFFSEVTPVDSIGSADNVMNPKGPDKRKKAEAQLLAAWLNFVNGAIDWNETLQLDDGSMLSLGEALWRAESILSDVNSTDAQFVEALEIAETVNLLDEGKSSCK